jgi:hypothetical protein
MENPRLDKHLTDGWRRTGPAGIVAETNID